MKGSLWIDPGVIRVVKVIHSSPIGRNGTHMPLVSTEGNWLGGGYLSRAFTLDCAHCNDRPTRDRNRVHRGRWVISGFNQQGCVFEPEVSIGTPGRVGLDRNKSLVRPGLPPPWPTPGVHDDLLPWTRT